MDYPRLLIGDHRLKKDRSMISLSEGIIHVQGRKEVIRGFAVWFQTPFGLFENHDEAIERVRGSDFLPDLMIRPVAVVLGETTYEVCGGP